MTGLENSAASTREVTFESSGVRLAGTLVAAQEPRRGACVVMIAGSGQVDRDENHKRFPLNVFGVFAEHLEKRGFDSLRYDKRGVGESGGDFWTAGLTDNAADAAAALEFVRGETDVRQDKVFLLGHSEGAYLATKIAAETPGLARSDTSCGRSQELRGGTSLAGGTSGQDDEGSTGPDRQAPSDRRGQGPNEATEPDQEVNRGLVPCATGGQDQREVDEGVPPL